MAMADPQPNEAFDVWTDDEDRVHLRVDREGTVAVSNVVDDPRELAERLLEAAGIEVVFPD